MSGRILRRRWTIRMLAAATLMGAVAPPCSAQDEDIGGRWALLDSNVAPLMPASPSVGALYFIDSLNGYRRIAGGVQQTTDGGRSWTSAAAYPDTAEYILPDGFAWRSDGMTSTDGGRTWSALGRSATDFVAASRTRWTILRPSSPRGPGQLFSTADAGVTWSGDVLPGFLPLPFPDDMESPSTMVIDLARQEGSRLWVVTSAQGVIGQAMTLRYYLGELDLDAGGVTWRELVFWRGGRGPGIVRMLSSRVALADEYLQDNYFHTYRLRNVWRTEDGGVSWTARNDLEWIGLSTVRFLTPQTGVSRTARTTDGGATWQRWSTPFGSAAEAGRVFQAIDSSHWVMCDSDGLFAATSDGGRTWWRSPHRRPFLALAATGGNVFVGRDGRSMLVSRDSGITWRDLGMNQELPNCVSRIVAIGWLDPGADPLRMLAVAGSVDSVGRHLAHVLLSRDGGDTWTRGARLTALDEIVFQESIVDEPLWLVTAPGEDGIGRSAFIAGLHGLYASDDNGATWTLRADGLSIAALGMRDANNGVMLHGDWDRPGLELYSTSDGGFTWTLSAMASTGNTYVSSVAADLTGYRTLIVNAFADFKEWTVFTSADGTGWTRATNSHALPQLKGGSSFWLDTRRVYVVGRGASILFSDNGGASFTQQHKVLSDFAPIWTDPAGSVYDLYFRPLSTAMAARHIYITLRPRRIARWSIEEVPTAAPANELSGSFEPSVSVADGVLEVATNVQAPADVRFTIVDVLGRRLETRIAGQRSAGVHSDQVDIAGYPAGRYFLMIESRASTSAASLRAVPFTIAR